MFWARSPNCCASHEYGISVHCLPVTVTSTRIVRDGESDRISPLLGVCGDIAYECECRLSCHGFLVSLFFLCEHIQYNKHIRRKGMSDKHQDRGEKPDTNPTYPF